MTNPFTDRAAQPTAASLSKTLGRTKRHWDAILAHAAERYDGVSQKWMFYAGVYGWTLKLERKRRAVLYMAPRQGHFSASMALREPAVAALRTSGLPAELIEEIASSKPFGEGRPARLDVTNLQHVATVQKLLALKLST